MTSGFLLRNLNGEAEVKRTWLVVTALVLVGIVSLFSHNLVFAKPQHEPPFASNLKVLTFVKSRAQLLSWMEMMEESLGVNCDFCHNPQNFASDVKPTKLRARSMLKMLLQIRHEYFTFPHAIKPTCYTCHRGHTIPVNAPSGGFPNFNAN